jgi:hypothetical protein
VTVSTGACSPVLGVDSTSVVITEGTGAASWYQVTAITGLPGSTPPVSYITSSSLSGQTVTVSTSGGATAVTTGPYSVVTFTNAIVPGWLEVCKNAQAGSGLTGTFTFTVTSLSMTNPLNVPWTATATANVGACSQPV